MSKFPMSEKTAEMVDAIEALFPGTVKAIAEGSCPCCRKPVDAFKDALSYKEYLISGMCQKCQDSVFGGEE